MLEPRSRAAFRREPHGAFVHGERWLYFSVDPSLFGYAIWDRPSADDIRGLVALLQLELDRPWHDALVDLGDLTSVAPDAFEAIASYTRDHHAALAKIIRRTAIVRPRGLVGAIASGFFEVATKPFEVTFHATREEALSSLERTDVDACLDALDAARAAVVGEPPFLLALRAFLAEHLHDPGIEDAAGALGTSARTLQRRLTEADSTFAGEIQRARLVAAERLLVESDAPITTIALDVGFKASQHFASAFAKHAGMTPSEFRAKRRGAG